MRKFVRRCVQKTHHEINKINMIHMWRDDPCRTESAHFCQSRPCQFVTVSRANFPAYL